MSVANLDTETLEDIFAGRPNPNGMDYPFYSLLAPGMPLPGPNFVAHATALSGQPAVVEEGTGASRHAVSVDWATKVLYLRALYDSGFSLPVRVKGEMSVVTTIPGHFWGFQVTGPRVPAEGPRVMVVGKMPGYEEVQLGRNMCGPTGIFLQERLDDLEVPKEEYDWWYVCNLVRWMQVDPRGGALPRAWIKDCLPILHQELRLIRPEYILCIGTEATKEICGTGNTLSNMFGRYIEKQIPIHDEGETPEYHTAKVMAITQPKAVMNQTELLPQFDRQLRNFVQLTRGQEFSDGTERYQIHYMHTERELEHYVDWILSQPGHKRISVDAEWHGQHPGEPGSYMRTVQICHDGVNAGVVVLKHAGGAQAFQPGNAAAIRQLRRLLDRDDVLIIGHFFASDSPWLIADGLDLRHRYTVPATPEECRGGNYSGLFDTALALHAFDETGDFKLEVASARWLGARRWDVRLNEWKKAYCHQHNLKDAELEGYGECPFDILGPYSGYDVIYTWQLAWSLMRENGMLDSDRNQNSSWTPFHVSSIAFLGFLEMHITGTKVDPQRIDDLTDLYMEVREERLLELRSEINWPTFNPRSSQQCAEMLFGEELNGKQRTDPMVPERIRPEGAVTLGLTPVKTTGAKPKTWEQVVARGEEHLYNPSTDKETLGILGAVSPTARHLRDIRFVDHVLKSVLRPPEHDADGLLEVAGRRVYKGGMAKFLCHDDRVRSTFLQTKETGRASSARPPLQNLSKRREQDYKRIQGSKYRFKIRSFVISDYENPDEPTVLLETDYGGAELLGMAVQGRSRNMIAHCLDPDYDIHSHIAVEAFNLSVPPTKASFEDETIQGLRVGAKNIIFGVGYGRGAAACARQCQEEGNDITENDAQKIIDAIFERYPEIPEFQQACKDRVKVGWLRNCFGRYRRFIPSGDRTTMSNLEREAMNFPLQSMVADAVSWALYYLYHHPRKQELGYKIVLQIHDAIVLEVPTRSLDVVYNEIIPECMVDRVPFKACDLNGNPYPDSELYRFPIERDVQIRWGEHLTHAQCDSLNISRDYGIAV